MPAVSSRARGPSRSTFDTYFRDINETALLDADEEQDLAWRVHDGDAEARDHLVRANLRLVVNFARRHVGRGLPLEDLIAEGNLGLLRAVEAFDPSLGLRFSTYAKYWITQSIKRAVVNTGKTVRLPQYMAQLVTRWHQAAALLQEELGRAPTPEEIGGRLGLSAKKLAVLQKALRIHGAGVATDAPESRPALDDLTPEDLGRAPDARALQADELQQVLDLLDRMDTRQATVLRLRFGLGGEEPLTLQEVGQRVGYTRERVRQIEKEALAALRRGLEADAD
jgi:RNA polymerase primary sigma factor